MTTLIKPPIMAGLLFLIVSQSALAQLSVSPKRVIFEGRERSHELLLINTGSKTKKYRIHFKQLRMTEKGGYENIEQDNAPDGLFASKAIRFSPRQVTLKPGMTQTVRLLVRKPKGFSDGEYRSHLTFSELPDDSLGLGEQVPQTQDGFAFRMKPLLGMSIPIIVRQGKLSQSVVIKNTAIKQNSVDFELHREGQASVYGQISALFKPANGADAIEIGEIRGLSVLTPLAWRTVNLPLSKPLKTLGEGELQLIYSNMEQNSQQVRPVLSRQTVKL